MLSVQMGGSVKLGPGWRWVHEDVRQSSKCCSPCRGLQGLTHCSQHCPAWVPAWSRAEQPQPCIAVHREGGRHVGPGEAAWPNHPCALTATQNRRFTVAPSWGCELSVWSTNIWDPYILSSGPVMFFVRLLPPLDNLLLYFQVYPGEIRFTNIKGTLRVKISPDQEEMWRMFAKRNRFSFLPALPHLFF